MLGSAIPRRWAFSIALVGLVTLFAVSYSAVWSDTASADSQGPGGGTGNSVFLEDSQILESAETLPQGLVLQPNQQVQLTLEPINLEGDVDNTMPGLNYQWSIIGGSGISIVAGSNAQTAIIQASSAGSGTVEGRITQVQESQDWIVIREATISVSNPGPTPTPSAPPTDPGTPPSSINNAQGVVRPSASILVSSNGVESGSSAEGQALRTVPAVLVRPGSVNNFFGISVESIDPSTLPAMPSNFERGSSAASITFYDVSGNPQTNFRLLRSAQICLPTNSSDRANGASNVRVMRYNSSVGQWVPLTTTLNIITGQACANSSNFSDFAIGVQQLPPTPGDPSDGGLPATGGWSPSSGMLLFAGLLGLALVGGGAVSMRRARSTRPE